MLENPLFSQQPTYLCLPISMNRQRAVKDLHNALDETFDCLKQLTAGADQEDNHTQLTELPYNDRSLVFIRASLQHSPTPSKVDDAVSSLHSVQSDIRRCKEKVDDAFLRTAKLYNLSNIQQPSTPTGGSPRSSIMMSIHNKLVRLFKPRNFRRAGAGDEYKRSNGESASAIAPTSKDRQSPDVSTSSVLLQLPNELLILIITDLNEDFLEDIPRGTDPLLALRL